MMKRKKNIKLKNRHLRLALRTFFTTLFRDFMKTDMNIYDLWLKARKNEASANA